MVVHCFVFVSPEIELNPFNFYPVLPHIPRAGVSIFITQHKAQHNFVCIPGVGSQAGSSGIFVGVANIKRIGNIDPRHGGIPSHQVGKAIASSHPKPIEVLKLYIAV